MPAWKTVFVDGLWRNNPALVQVLGLCPLLAVSNSAINGLGLGLATLLVLLLSNALVSLSRRFIPHAIRIPCYVLLIAAMTTAVQLLMQAYAYSLYQALGIFIPLIVTNCIILGRAEHFAARQPLLPALIDGLTHGLGFCAVLFVLGSLREIIGTGTWMAGATSLFGANGEVLVVELVHFEHPFLLAILPPGAFIGLGLMIALKNAIASRAPRNETSPLSLATRK